MPFDGINWPRRQQKPAPRDYFLDLIHTILIGMLISGLIATGSEEPVCMIAFAAFLLLAVAFLCVVLVGISVKSRKHTLG